MNTILTIVVAGGSGLRMGGETPKQFILLGGEPIVMRTLRRMEESARQFLAEHSQIVDNPVHKLVLVLPETHIPLWRELCREHHFDMAHTVVAGGVTRYHSVKNGLATAPEADIILVHDGVRPFVPDAVVAAVITGALTQGAVVPAVAVTDSLRRLTGTAPTLRSVAVDRTAYRAVQTPQGFRGALLREAYELPYDEAFTDDASVVETLDTGTPVILVPGDPRNIKITTPTDLKLAEILLGN